MSAEKQVPKRSAGSVATSLTPAPNYLPPPHPPPRFLSLLTRTVTSVGSACPQKSLMTDCQENTERVPAPSYQKRGENTSREGRRPREPDWALLISLKETEWPEPATQPNWVIWALPGKVEVTTSLQAIPPPPPPVTPATGTRIYSPGRRGLASGRHSEGATPTPIATASQDARSLQLAASAGAPGTPTAVPASCRESILSV